MSSKTALFLLFVNLCIIPMFKTNISANNEYFSSPEHYFVSKKEEINQALSPRYLKVPTFITAYEGADVILSCTVENLADRMVFWIRNSDLQILTAGLITFSSDQRFKVNHENSVDENDWSLLITNVRIEDSGIYECQINTDPKMKLNINLLVKEGDEKMEMMDSPFYGGTASIDGDHIKNLVEGQSVTLTCRLIGVLKYNNSQENIQWIKNGEPLSLKSRSEGSVTTIDTIWTQNGDGISRLTLAMLKFIDEGKYSCSSGGYVSETVELQIIHKNIKEKGTPLKNESSGKIQQFNGILLYLFQFLILFNFIIPII